MQPREGNRKTAGATRPKQVSIPDSEVQEIDLKLVEALARIERVRSKALAALGSMLAAG